MTAARVWRIEAWSADRLVHEDEDAVADRRQPGQLHRGEEAEHAGLVQLSRAGRRQPVLGALFALTVSLGVWAMIVALTFRLFV